SPTGIDVWPCATAAKRLPSVSTTISRSIASPMRPAVSSSPPAGPATTRRSSGPSIRPGALWSGRPGCAARSVSWQRPPTVSAGSAYVLAMDDGRVLNSTPVFPKGKLAFSADGRQLAVNAGGELQVWEMEELTKLDWHPSTQDGFLQVAFSPDGRLLFTGDRLWNPLTGEELGHIGVERTEGWLEGGPPRRGRRVLHDGFIEAGLGGIRRWGADCKQRFQRGGHFSLSSGDLLFSSDGRFYVAFHHGLEVRAVHDDHLIASLNVKLDRHTLELSPDDRHVAWV